jgi:hypothetical protein
MRARTIGRLVGRAAVIAALGLGVSLAAGGTAQAGATSGASAAFYEVAGHRSPYAVSITLDSDWQ